eukprot:COSAG01_NODE_796_length_13536_cov_5.683635_15_plen_220_part_00
MLTADSKSASQPLLNVPSLLKRLLAQISTVQPLTADVVQAVHVPWFTVAHLASQPFNATPSVLNLFDTHAASVVIPLVDADVHAEAGPTVLAPVAQPASQPFNTNPSASNLFATHAASVVIPLADADVHAEAGPTVLVPVAQPASQPFDATPSVLNLFATHAASVVIPLADVDVHAEAGPTVLAPVAQRGMCTCVCIAGTRQGECPVHAAHRQCCDVPR